MSTHKKHLTRRRVLGAYAIGVAATGAAVAGGTGLLSVDKSELAAHTLRVGVTDAFANGRPRVTVNDWVSPLPSAPTQPSTRSLTTGSYRGNNHTFTFNVPTSAWKTDTSQYNVLKINVVSGSGGSAYLSAGTSFDCMDLLA